MLVFDEFPIPGFKNNEGFKDHLVCFGFPIRIRKGSFVNDTKNDAKLVICLKKPLLCLTVLQMRLLK